MLRVLNQARLATVRLPTLFEGGRYGDQFSGRQLRQLPSRRALILVPAYGAGKTRKHAGCWKGPARGQPWFPSNAQDSPNRAEPSIAFPGPSESELNGVKWPGSILVSNSARGCEMEESEKHKSDHEVFMSGMPPAPELILEDLPWSEPLSEDPEEDRRLRQKQVAAANSTYSRQFLMSTGSVAHRFGHGFCGGAGGQVRVKRLLSRFVPVGVSTLLWIPIPLEGLIMRTAIFADWSWVSWGGGPGCSAKAGFPRGQVSAGSHRGMERLGNKCSRASQQAGQAKESPRPNPGGNDRGAGEGREGFAGACPSAQNLTDNLASPGGGHLRWWRRIRSP